MKDTNYAYCVARIRAKETELLSSEFMYRLIECSGYKESVRMLTEKGWMDSEQSVNEALKVQSIGLWTFLSDCVPDKTALANLCILNDLFNIKVSVKCALTSNSPENLYVYPTTLDLKELANRVKTIDFSNIFSEETGICVQNAYDMANKTENGQIADIMIDKIALDILYGFASYKKNNKIFSEICSFIADTSNIKIALRCSATHKNIDFAESAISECTYLDRKKLIEFCVTDEEKLKDYLLSGKYSDGVELYLSDPVLYDKWCDESVLKIADDAKYTAFGFSPVCAYYYLKTTEIKNIRIIMNSKLSGLSKEKIRERVRVANA